MTDPGKRSSGEPEETVLLEREEIFRGKIVDLRVDRVRLPNGHVSDLEVIAHPGAAVVVPLTATGDVVLVRQFRYATGGWLLELPAGKLSAGEKPASCAARELEEETGLRPGRLEPLGWIWSTPGFTDERMWLFIARDLEQGRQNLEGEEVLELTSLSFAEALSRVERGEINDAKTVCALLLADKVVNTKPLDAARRDR